MPLESTTYISGLVSTNPAATDTVNQADDHIRMLKASLLATFPNITGAVTKTHSQINDLLEKAGGTMTGALTLSGAPTLNLHAATKAYVDSNSVIPARTISAGTGLTGGGDLSANRTLSIATGGVDTVQLADNSVTNAKLADNAVSTAEIADNSITNAKMADNSVDSAEIVAGAVDPVHLSQKITLETAQATTSGNSKEYASIPSWVKRITIQFNQVSLSAAGIITVQLGDSGGYETSGYVGTSALVSFHSYSITAGIGVDINSNTLAFSGQMLLEHLGGNVWVSSHTLGASGGYIVLGGASKTLSDTLDRLKIMATDTAGATGAMNFDSGSVNIIYE